jgi:hypothetical protein
MTIPQKNLSEIARQLRVLSSQVTGPRWTKLQDAADKLDVGDTEGIVDLLKVAETWSNNSNVSYSSLAAQFVEEEPVPDIVDVPLPPETVNKPTLAGLNKHRK